MATPDEVPVWLRDLCERLQDDKVILTVLNLNIRRVNGSMMRVLSEALVCDAGLHSLNLTSALENRTDMMSSSQVLQPLIRVVLSSTTSSLQVLHLSYNALTGPLDGMGKALSLNRSLTELHLDHNRIDCTTATELASGLGMNQTLQILELSSNLIGDRGASNIAQAFTRNKHLHTLGLSRNFMGRQGGQSLVDCMWKHKNTSLKRIDVENNPTFPDDMAGWLTALCQANMAGRSVLLFETDEVPGLVTPILAKAAATPSALYVFLKEVQSIVPKAQEPNTGDNTIPPRKKARH